MKLEIMFFIVQKMFEQFIKKQKYKQHRTTKFKV